VDRVIFSRWEDVESTFLTPPLPPPTGEGTSVGIDMP